MSFVPILILFISLIASNTLISIPNSLAQDTDIPNWVKNTAGWWSDDQISETEFLTAITYLINNQIIFIDFIPCSLSATQTDSSVNLVPNWIKNNAEWWSEDLISDIDFINGLTYLIDNQIMQIDNKKIKGDVPIDDVIFSPSWIIDSNDLAWAKSGFFEVYGIIDNCPKDDSGTPRWYSIILGLNPNNMDQYNEVAIWNDPQKAAVVYPSFTYSAYYEPGFYTYYRGECDECTTTELHVPRPAYTSSGNAHQALTLLGYTSLSDMDIDRNPEILQQFDKIVMLHNEYVTRTMFDAITSHPKVIYLYPNALYAEIEVNYTDETMTLIRGHNYPEPEIKNGFDWEFDNTHPYEYDKTCANMEMYKIENGWMTTCYPELLFVESEQIFNLLKAIKDV